VQRIAPDEDVANERQACGQQQRPSPRRHGYGKAGNGEAGPAGDLQEEADAGDERRRGVKHPYPWRERRRIAWFHSAHMLGQTPAGTRAVSLAGASVDSSAIGVRHM
jgi:hypothetical protein